MDADRFDTIIRTLALPDSRRSLLGIGLAAGLGSLLERLDVGAKRKKKKKRKNRKKSCRPKCAGKACGSDGCGGTCGECEIFLTCQGGTCACPDETEFCGGACWPRCPASTPGRVVARHPATCACCVRPGSFTCPENATCCIGPDSIPCCAQPCEPIAEYPICRERENSVCHYDVECNEGYRCPEGPDPRACELIRG